MKWLVYVLALPKNDSIIQRALFIILRSVEMIAHLRVGFIFFLSVLVPMGWLSANTYLLENRKWREKNMACVINCVYKNSLKIKERPDLILHKSFMLSIFSKLYRKLPELKDYIDWHRGENMNMVHSCSRIEQHMCGMELVIAELFYPKEAANRQTYATSLDLVDELADWLFFEFQDTSKVTHYYLNDLGGKYSMSKTTPKEKEEGYGIHANNDPSERKFAIFRYALFHMGNASLYVAAAEAQSWGNNDWGVEVDSLATRRKSPPQPPQSLFPHDCASAAATYTEALPM